MKYILIIAGLLFAGTLQAQFTGTDSLRNYNNRYITNNPATAFTNLRLHTLLRGMIDYIDTARAGTGGGGAVGVDTLWALNDSTVRYRKNGVFKNFVLKGVYDTRRKVDTAYALNDSTLQIKINGTNRNIILPGRYWDLQGVLNNGSTLIENETVTLLDSLTFTSGMVIIDTLNLPSLQTTTDTTANKPVVVDGSGNVHKMTNWPVSPTDSTIFATVYSVDTAKANLRDEIAAGEDIDATLRVGHVDTATVIQFGYPDTGFVQQVSGADHIGTPFILYPYSARDTNIVNPKPIRGFKTYTNLYDGGYPLNTITEIFGYGSYALNDHMFRIAHEQNWYNSGEFHVGYKLRNMGSEIRLFSPTWDWDTPDLSTTTFRAGQFAFHPVLSDTQMLAMTPGQTTITGFRSSVPAFRVQLFSNDGTKSGILMNTQANQTYINWHLNTVTPNNHSIVWDLPGSLIMGCARTGASSDPEFDLRFANLSNNRMLQWKRGTRIMGVLHSGTGGNDHWVFGGEYTTQMSNAVNVKTYRSYAQKPFGVAITDAADVITKAVISTDTLGRVRINVPSPNTAWADGLLNVTETEDFAVYGSTVLVNNNSGLNRILALKNTHAGSFSGPSLKFWNNGGTTGTNGYGIEFYSNNTTGGFANAMVMRNYEGGPHVIYGQSAEIARFTGAGEVQIGSTTDQGAYTLQNTGGFYQSGSVKIDLGSDADYDLHYRAPTTGLQTRLAIGTANQQLRVNGTATGYEWVTTSINGSTTHDFGTIANNSSATTTISVTGAADGDYVLVTKPVANGWSNGESYTAWVSGPDQVTVRQNNNSGGSAGFGSQTINVKVIKQ